jgi:signal transduction histidine kinase
MRTGEPASSKKILGLTYRQLIGGRWAISLIAYLLNAPLNLLAILGNLDSALRAQEASTWFAIAVIGYLVLGAVVLIANYTLFRNRSITPVPVWWVVALGAMAGGIRGVVVGTLAESWGVTTGGFALIATRTVTGMLLGAVLLPLAALLLSTINAYVTRRESLLRERRVLHAERMRAEGVSEALHVALVASVKGDLDEVARTQDADLARSVSHRVWEAVDGETPQPRVRWGRVLATAFSHNPYPTFTVSFIWLLSAWGALFATIGVARALMQMIFTLACIAACFSVGRRFTSVRVGVSLLTFVVVMTTLVILTGPVAAALFDPRPLAASAPLIIINTVWLPLMTVATGIVVNAVRSSERVLATLTHQVDDEEIAAAAAQQEAQRIRRDLATRLHGNVQSRLLAAAGLMRQPALLQQAGITDPALLLQELTSGIDVSSGIDERSLTEQIDAITRPWSALMSITVNIVGDVDEQHASAVARVVEEGLANSYRHGSAREVRCDVQADGAEVLVVIHDDGRGDGRPQVPGIGSAVLNSLSSDWSMQVLPEGGHRLTVRLAV